MQDLRVPMITEERTELMYFIVTRSFTITIYRENWNHKFFGSTSPKWHPCARTNRISNLSEL